MADKLFRPWVNMNKEKKKCKRNLREDDNKNTKLVVNVNENNIQSNLCEKNNEINVNQKYRMEKNVTEQAHLNGPKKNIVYHSNTSLSEESDPRFCTNQFPTSSSTVNLPSYNPASFISYLNYLTTGLYHPSEMFPLLDGKDDPYRSSNFLNTFPNTCHIQDIPQIPQISSINHYDTLPTYNTSVEKAAELVNLQDVAAKQMKKLRPKKFRCEYCDVAFSNNGQLKGHVRIHTGERPYKCDSEGCGKSFTRNEELTRHKRIHTGLRPHSCSACGKKFGRKDHLKKHTRTHENRDLLYHVSTPLSVFSLGMFPSLA
ncbi:PREDICTED: zinc finger protein 112-like [Polistes dominula]|uniref:Zinc finger protein 112-like n=1 Tax=Polistes dominula TaxID=743375 RepID=A0ABM1I6H3_POLDO|nr:PREDICTED: zinc finger protein 112-like [Polistes dominula]